MFEIVKKFDKVEKLYTYWLAPKKDIKPMTDRHRQQWEALGGNDPYWAVLTNPKKKGGRWNKEDFFQTGIDEINGVLAKISRLGIQLRFGVALDYGCGVGRLSQALASSFERVVGIDFSEAMLVEARSAHGQFTNIQFLRNSGESLIEVANGTVDFVYSNIVLQHIPRKQQGLLIREFCRVLRPGAALVFQTPSHPNMATIKGYVQLLFGNRVLNIARKMIYGKGHVMELHTLRRNEVLKILSEEGMSVREAERYDSAGNAFISYRYYAIKS